MASRIFAALLALVLFGCTDPETEPTRYLVTPDMTPQSAASLSLGHIDTGFLYFGITTAVIAAIDGESLMGEAQNPVLLRPGRHAVLIRLFRDPVAAYGCVRLGFEKGKSYIARFTKPEMEKTTIWVEDKVTGATVSEKYETQNYKEPLMSGALVQVLLAHPAVTCLPEMPETKRPAPATASGDHASTSE